MRKARHRRIVPVLALFNSLTPKVDAQSSTIALMSTTTTTPPGNNMWDPYSEWFRNMVAFGAVMPFVLFVWLCILTTCFVRHEMFTKKQTLYPSLKPSDTRYSFIKNNVPAFADHIRV